MYICFWNNLNLQFFLYLLSFPCRYDIFDKEVFWFCIYFALWFYACLRPLFATKAFQMFWYLWYLRLLFHFHFSRLPIKRTPSIERDESKVHTTLDNNPQLHLKCYRERALFVIITPLIQVFIYIPKVYVECLLVACWGYYCEMHIRDQNQPT